MYASGPGHEDVLRCNTYLFKEETLEDEVEDRLREGCG